MRLAILADIHGNYRALEAVLADVDLCSVDRILSLGDNVGYGPEPDEVVQALINREVASVMGNHELGLVSRSSFNRLHSIARDSLQRTRSLLSATSLAWLTSLPGYLVQGEARYVHGCPPDSITAYLYAPTHTRLQRLFATYPESICFAGHIHDLGWHQEMSGTVASRSVGLGTHILAPQTRYLLLPGSVGQPRDGLNWHAKYMVWDQAAATIEVRAVAYDVHTTVRLLGERGFPASNAKRLFW